MQGTKETSITVRVTEELKKKLEVMASKDGRTLSNFIQNILDKVVNKK